MEVSKKRFCSHYWCFIESLYLKTYNSRTRQQYVLYIEKFVVFSPIVLFILWDENIKCCGHDAMDKKIEQLEKEKMQLIRRQIEEEAELRKLLQLFGQRLKK